MNRNILMDSIGVSDLNKINTQDVVEALKGEKGVWTGEVSYDDEPIMSVSYPLRMDNKVIGVIRFVSSLRETDKTINKISIILIWIGLIVVSISGLVSVFLSNTIVRPLREVTKVAEKMANSQLNIRSKKDTMMK